MQPAALLLVENGKVVKAHLDQEFINEYELLAQLREHGLEDFSHVRKCYLESNGHFSVLTEMPDKRKQEGNGQTADAVNKKS